jgi:hypothetical protein
MRIVTPEQLSQGIRVKGVDPATVRVDFRVIRRLPDGNYVVVEPRTTGQA